MAGIEKKQYEPPEIRTHGPVESVTEWGWDNKEGHGVDTDVKCLQIKGSF
jgi:hypothetical protein